MNKDFFDSNKLYLKSVVDYKTRYHKKPNPLFLDTTDPKTNLPQLVSNTKNTTALLNANKSVNSGSDG
jgi:hypothetical protein